MSTVPQPVDRDQIEGKDHRDMSRAEARLRIAVKVGLNSDPTTPFSKSDLNSIHFRLCGEFCTPRRVIGTEKSPSHARMRSAIAYEAGFFYDVTPTDVGDWKGNPFRRNQLRALVYALEQKDDPRPFMQR